MKIRMDKVEKLADFFRKLPLEDPPKFLDPDKFPEENTKGALDFFFAVTMHDYGFWIGNRNGYKKPFYGYINGRKLKGGDWLWAASKRMLIRYGPEFFDPKNLSQISGKDFQKWFSDDNGIIKMLDLETRQYYTHCLGYVISNFFHPLDDEMEKINEKENPLALFLNFTRCLPGYSEDKLIKKNILLAMILANRPEKFLRASQENWPPMIDYHIMRVALRFGILEELNRWERETLKTRYWASPILEEKIRTAVFEAIKKVIELSGKPMHFVDKFLWNARSFCPEMQKPECEKCRLKNICEKNTDLFQPVFRTTNY